MQTDRHPCEIPSRSKTRIARRYQPVLPGVWRSHGTPTLAELSRGLQRVVGRLIVRTRSRYRRPLRAPQYRPTIHESISFAVNGQRSGYERQS